MRFTKVGLTGGIGTGKSTVAQHWQRQGVAVIDADELAHGTLAPDTPTWRAIVTRFGEGILNADRTVNRPRLADIVFGDETQRAALNAIVHPVVRQRWTEWLAKAAAAGNARAGVVAIPLLYEVGVESEFDVVVCVGCSEATQRARLKAKGLSEAQMQARITSQWPVTRKMERADFVIWNDGTLETLQRQADLIWATIEENHHAP